MIHQDRLSPFDAFMAYAGVCRTDLDPIIAERAPALAQQALWEVNPHSLTISTVGALMSKVMLTGHPGIAATALAWLHQHHATLLAHCTKERAAKPPLGHRNATPQHQEPHLGLVLPRVWFGPPCADAARLYILACADGKTTPFELLLRSLDRLDSNTLQPHPTKHAFLESLLLLQDVWSTTQPLADLMMADLLSARSNLSFCAVHPHTAYAVDVLLAKAATVEQALQGFAQKAAYDEHACAAIIGFLHEHFETPCLLQALTSFPGNIATIPAMSTHAALAFVRKLPERATLRAQRAAGEHRAAFQSIQEAVTHAARRDMHA